MGLNVREVSKGPGSIMTGVNKVRELLLNGKLKVNRKNCHNTINEFETYAYPEKDEDRNQNEVPFKKGDHAMDALRYVVHMRVVDRKLPTYVQPAYQPISEFEAPNTGFTGPSFGTYTQSAYQPSEFES